jgi:hypothetical protein
MSFFSNFDTLLTSSHSFTSISPTNTPGNILKDVKKNELEEIFFVFEESSQEELSQEKIDTLTTKTLYFHPQTISEEKQYFLLGIIQTSICNFQEYKLKDEITMLKFTKSKMAIKKIENIYMVKKESLIFEGFGFFLSSSRFSIERSHGKVV